MNGEMGVFVEKLRYLRCYEIINPCCLPVNSRFLFWKSRSCFKSIHLGKVDEVIIKKAENRNSQLSFRGRDWGLFDRNHPKFYPTVNRSAFGSIVCCCWTGFTKSFRTQARCGNSFRSQIFYNRSCSVFG